MEVRSASDLPAGHLDPWLVDFERSRAGNVSPPGLASMLRDVVRFFLSRDISLLRGRSTLDAILKAEQGPGPNQRLRGGHP